ncbi:MAG TPA: lysophospholipid acyltransferase family protein [Alkalispirochaeta sp.]|nr:lysophospholipid acyltransferase family protein [Alkalispirochaeta sp.]
MRTGLFLVLIVMQLFWWDLVDKVRMTMHWSWARAAVDRDVADRARRLLAIARFTIGLRVRIEIDEDRISDRFMVVANHQSVIEIAAIMAAFRNHSVRFVAKRELRHWFPAVSRVLRIQRHALISRHGDFPTAMRQIEHLGRTLRPREGAVIFPEGTRSRDGRVNTFHSGAIRQLVATGPLPMVVIAVDGGTGFSSLKDLAGMTPGHVFRLKMVAIYPPAPGKRALIAQLQEAQNLITQTITQWRGTVDI